MTCLYTVLNTPILLQYRYGMIRIYESKEESTNSYVGESKENLRFHKMSGVKDDRVRDIINRGNLLSLRSNEQ